MPITHAVDHARRRMEAHAVGPISFDEIMAHLAQERRDGGLAYAELMDASAGELTLTPGEFRRLVSELRRLGRDGAFGPTAVVVGSEFMFGMVRMLTTNVEDVVTMRPFRDRGEAERWLAAQADGAGGADGGDESDASGTR
jgi:hypothetical protein